MAPTAENGTASMNVIRAVKQRLSEIASSLPPGVEIVTTYDRRGESDFLTGPSEPPATSEAGWKDTFVAPPGKVTRVRIRVAPQTTLESQLHSGFNPFPFDATKGPGYV